MKSFVFLNLSSSPTDKRTKAFVKNGALSQAAKYAHSRRSWFAASNRQGRTITSSRHTNSNEQGRLSKTTMSSSAISSTRESKPPEKPSKRQPRWRVAVQQRRVSPPVQKSPEPSPSKRLPEGERLVPHVEAAIAISIPTHRGNSDPFQCAAIPMTASDYAVMDVSSLAWVRIIWSSEINVRRNQESLATGYRDYMPSILDHASTAHGILSEAYSRRAHQSKALGLPHESALRESLKHKLQATRLLRELVDNFRAANDRNDILDDIRRTSAQLGVAEWASGNFDTALTHYAAVGTVMDLQGSWKTLSPVAVDGLIFPAFASAWYARKRPVLNPDRWDPGPSSVLNIQLLRTLLPSKRAPSPVRPLFSTMKPQQRVLLDQTRDLLDVEELKYQRSTWNAESATQLFRWSNRRKLAIRARNLHHWCDLRETAGNTLPSWDMILCLTVRCFDHSIFEECLLPETIIFRPGGPLLAELAAGLRSLSPPFPETDNTTSEEGIDDLMSTDDRRRFDMLWIYSVGAYLENYLLRFRRHPGGLSVRPDQRKDEGASDFFSPRFRTLARALDFTRFEDLATLLSEEYVYCARLQETILKSLVSS